MTTEQHIAEWQSRGNEIRKFPPSKRTKGLNWKRRLRGDECPCTTCEPERKPS